MLKHVKFQARKTILTGLNIPFNRGGILSCVGLIPCAGYGIGGASAQSLNTSEHASSPYERDSVSDTVPHETSTDTPEPSDVSIEIVTKNESPQSSISVNDEQQKSQVLTDSGTPTNTATDQITIKPDNKSTEPLKQPTITPNPQNGGIQQASLDNYDNEYLKSVYSKSMASTLRNHFLMVSESHSIGEDKTKKIADLAGKKPEQKLFTYGQKKNVTPEELTKNPKGAAKGCRNALSYTIFGTYGYISVDKEYGDLLGDACGRDDKPKPKGW